MSHEKMKRMSLALTHIATLGLLAAAVGPAAGQIPQPPDRELLLDDFATLAGWRCSNGGEYPGAKGGIEREGADDDAALKLNYDFTGGGSYVAAVRSGGVPVETTGFAFTVRPETDCHLFCRVADSNKTFQGFYRKLKAGEEARAQLSLKGPWRHSWGRGDAKVPAPPIRQLWICVQHEKDLPKVGAVLINDVKATSTGDLAALRAVAPVQDVGFDALGWRVSGEWLPGWQVLYLRCDALGENDAELSFTLPQMGRDDVTRFNLSAEEKTCRFRYMPPLNGRGNPYNRYRVAVTLKASGGVHTETIELAGEHSSEVNLGSPIHSSKIGKSIVGTNTHFSFASGNTGAFSGWHKHRELTDMIARAGIKWIRDMLGTEKDAHGDYRIREFIINWIREAKQQGIDTVGLINMHTGETQEEFVAKCRAIAQQTKGLVDVFELGNEPNNFGNWRKEHGGTWNGKEKDGSTSPWVKAHLKYTNAGADAIRQVRPDATIVGLGACTPTNYRYLDLGVSDALDGVVDHPYTYSMPPEKAPYGWSLEERDGVRTGDEDHTFAGLVDSYVEKFGQTGKDRTLWLTEFGWTCFQFGEKNAKGLFAGFSERAQAIYLVRRFIQCMTLPAIKAACQYDFLDDYGSSPFNSEANFGLIRADYSPKPSYYAMQRMTSLFAGYEHVPGVAVVVEEAPLHRSMTRSELVHDWDEVAITAANGVLAYGFENPDLPNERQLAVWSKLPVSGEFSNRFASIRISGWGEFREHPLAVDLLTGETFDVPVRTEGEDLIFELLLADDPLVIKLFRRR